MTHNHFTTRRSTNHRGLLPASDVAVVMVPLPAQGHLNQLLHLSRRIAALGIPVHYAGAAIHLRQARLRLHINSADIQFQELPIPYFDSPPPDPRGPTRFPSQIMPSLAASLHLRAPLVGLVTRLSSNFRRVAVVYDSLMSYVVQDLAAVPRVECYIFQSISAFSAATWEASRLRDLAVDRKILKQIPSLEGYYPPAFAEFLAVQGKAHKVFSGEIYNSCREIEGFVLGPLERRMRRDGKKIFAMGPFNPVSVHGNEMRRGTRHRCLEWLDKQGAGTVVLVSFGTTCSFTDEQVREVAQGLEKSGQRFVWVLREADRGDVFAGGGGEAVVVKNVDEGFEERVRNRGIVVRDWAPQLEILGHPSTGGFVSHCGWNSCLESMSMGVPIATWAQHSDQPANAALITKVLKIGVEIKKWSREEELVSSRTIEKAVRKLMTFPEIRQRAAELGKAIRKSVMEGGTSRREMDSFIAHITRHDC